MALIFNRFLTDFGSHLGPSWAVLGASWAILGRLGGLLGRLGGLLGPLGGQTRKMTMAICFLGPSWDRLGELLGAVLALGSPSWADFGRLGPSKNRCKNRSKK